METILECASKYQNEACRCKVVQSAKCLENLIWDEIETNNV